MNRIEKWILIVACIILGVSWLGVVYNVSSTGNYKPNASRGATP